MPRPTDSQADFAYVTHCRKTARQTVAALWSATMAAGWTVLGDYDLSGLIPDDQVEQGVEVKSLDICRPEHAKPLVQADPLTALCMPCNVLVRSQGEQTTVAVLKPGVMLPRLFPGAIEPASTLPEAIDSELQAIIKQAIAT